MKYYYNLKQLFSVLIYFKMQFIPVMAIFSSHNSLVSHDPSEIILICCFAAQETFLIINNVENSCAASYFLWKL